MKQLITDQLIEELNQEINFFEKHIKAKTLSESTLALYGYKTALLKEVKVKIQSLRQQEVQNVKDAVSSTVSLYVDPRCSDKYIQSKGNDYFNQTFKQEDKK